MPGYFINIDASKEHAEINSPIFSTIAEYISAMDLPIVESNNMRFVDISKLMTSSFVYTPKYTTDYIYCNGPAFGGTAFLSKEQWEGKIYLSFFDKEGKKTNSILPGTSPHLNLLHTINAGSTVTLERTSSKLKIGSTEYSKSNFIEGVIPTVLIIECQAGGGGGAGAFSVTSGAGGGSGAYIIAVVYLGNESKFSLSAGSGGEGGTWKSAGSTGGPSYIEYLGDLFSYILFKSNGGTGGGGSNDSYGTGGDTVITTSVENSYVILKKILGVNGGKGSSALSVNGSDGSDINMETVYVTRRDDDKNGAKNLNGGLGGKSNGYGGGGAGSIMGDGAAAGQSASNAGAGGGGGGYHLTNRNAGGNGGGGFIKIYY